MSFLFPGGTVVKNPPVNSRRPKRCRFDPWVWKFFWRRKWEPIPAFLLGKFYVQRSLVSFSPWGCRESDMTEWLSTHTHNKVL